MENKKPDLTNFRNIFNYVVYGLAGIVSILYFSGGKKDDKIVATLEKTVSNCEEENKEYRKNNQLLIENAYHLRQENAIKDTLLLKSAETFDSISYQNLKMKTEPFLQKIKKYSK